MSESVPMKRRSAGAVVKQRNNKLIKMNTTNETKSASKSTRDQTQPPPALVRFELTNPSARKVCVAGNFNNWRPEATEMIPTGGGKWAKELRLQPGTYEYRFVVDGEWTTDPKASGTVPNPFGDLNSLLAKRIGDSARGLDRREKYALPVTSTTGDRKQPR